MQGQEHIAQKAEIQGANNIVVQAIGDGNNLSVNLPHLTLIPPRNRRPESNNNIHLLNPYARSIELSGREADMQSFRFPFAQSPVGQAPARLALPLN